MVYRDCPNELKEAISGLIFASSRCGEFPELQQVRDIFTTRFGKEFTASAIDLRNQCGVDPKVRFFFFYRSFDLIVVSSVVCIVFSEV